MHSHFPKGFRQNCLFHFIYDSETAIESLMSLRQRMPSSMDDFDETRATQGGTDIVGKVNENGTPLQQP